MMPPVENIIRTALLHHIILGLDELTADQIQKFNKLNFEWQNMKNRELMEMVYDLIRRTVNKNALDK